MIPAVAASLVLGCGAPPATHLVEDAPGSPLAGLTDEEAGRFIAGKALFNRPFTPEEGLGPLFNQTQCSSCHDLPSSGGHGAEPVQKATRFDDGAGCSLLPEHGGDLLQMYVTPRARALGLGPERIPSEATGASEIVAPPLYGLGLVAALSLDDIAANADPDDRNGDGVSGRLGLTGDGTPGLFGMKSNHATLASFIESATRGELGLTTPAHPREESWQGAPLPEGADPAPDPEVDDHFLASVEAYVRFLALPAPAVPESKAERGAVARGERAFDDVGCADCHTPVWTTGESDATALSRKTFRAYSDFLLHDVGPDLADICGDGASPSEWRTTRLVGLKHRRVFLHNGRAQRLEDAVMLHGGEGAGSRDAFASLPERAKQDLIRFLQSL